jgi:ribosomal protein S20
LHRNAGARRKSRLANTIKTKEDSAASAAVSA